MGDFKIQSINQTFREIFQSSAEGIFMVERDGQILLANRVSEKMFGYEPGELTSLNIDKLLPERFRAKHHSYREGFNEHPEPRRMGVGRDLVAVRKDGTEFPVEVSLSYSNSGGQMLIMAFVIDISLRKKSEEALRQSEEQLLVYAAELEKKVKARTEALNNTIKELEKEVHERKRAEEETRKALAKERELNDLKTKFVSIASHEFRTPLSTILSSTSLIAQYQAKGDHDKAEKHIQRIKSNVNHLTAILNDFLSLGRLEEGRVEISQEPLHLSEFFQEVQDEMKSTLKPGQFINFNNQAEKNFTFNTDARILRNILFNLLSNASKYSPEGKPIHLSCRIIGAKALEVSVKDEGIGIPEDDKRHMFERFFRATNATNIQGTGLGLNIVRRYLDLLNGNITFESEYTKGSIFTITIPIEH